MRHYGQLISSLSSVYCVSLQRNKSFDISNTFFFLHIVLICLKLKLWPYLTNCTSKKKTKNLSLLVAICIMHSYSKVLYQLAIDLM